MSNPYIIEAQAKLKELKDELEHLETQLEKIAAQEKKKKKKRKKNAHNS